MRALLLAATAATLAFAPANAQSLTSFFRGANLDSLAQSPTVLNLTAQSATKMAGGDVNAFNDFFLINGPGKLMVNFDGQLQNKGQVNLPGWIGVLQYSNHDISADIQEGFEKVKARYHMPGAKAGHVTVYMTINTHQLVYDYAIQRTPGAARCQEYLFTPATGGFQLGLQTACFTTLRAAMRSTAGRPGRTR
jgi:hypothetical protein